jgi:cytoskeletal protein CcmA (bactofilin family)
MKITDCLEIHGTGYVEGDVEVGSLVVDEGGTLQGVCIRKDQTQNLDANPGGVAKGGSLPIPGKLPDLKKIDTRH